MILAKQGPAPVAVAGASSVERLKGRERILIACVAAALVVPCVWQRHIESVDLPSHVYNAWLAWLITHGQVSGLKLVHPLTNVLADWILSAGFAAFGPAWAARILCVIAVEAFFWGTFAFTSVVNERLAWVMAPCLGMLSYGLIFYMGLMNFYLGTACAVWMLVALWRFSFRRLMIAVALGALGVLGNPLPVAWAICSIAYIYLTRRLPDRLVAFLPAAGTGVLVAAHFLLLRYIPSQWSFHQVTGIYGELGLTGTGQFAPFASKYFYLSLGILILFIQLFFDRVSRGVARRDAVGQLWLLGVVAFAVIPFSIWFPGYAAAFFLVPERLSLFAVILFCAWVGGVSHGHGYTRLFSVLAVAYFAFLYADQRALNRADAEITSVVSSLPPGQRVVAAVGDSGSRLNGLERVLDWACIGRCFDYGNSEPTTRAFRVRVTGANPAVDQTGKVAFDVRYSRHTVTPAEAPLYSICPSSVPGQRFEARRLEAGEKTCRFSLPVTPPLVGLFR
jgi:hypothetical protein